VSRRQLQFTPDTVTLLVHFSPINPFGILDRCLFHISFITQRTHSSSFHSNAAGAPQLSAVFIVKLKQRTSVLIVGLWEYHWRVSSCC